MRLLEEKKRNIYWKNCLFYFKNNILQKNMLQQQKRTKRCSVI